MITCSRLTVRYRPAAVGGDRLPTRPGEGADGDRPALDEVSLQATDGCLTAIVGPNGSGKSTFVRALLGRVPIAGGSIALDGEDLTRLSRRVVARRVAVVAQREEPIFPTRVQQYVALGTYPTLGAWSPLPSHDEAVDRAARAAGVSHLLDRRTDELSGGEWQRVRMARAMAQGTQSLVLDEPTAALDIGHEMDAFELMASLAGAGRCVLAISHQLNLVARFAQHVVLLHKGRVVAAGTPDQVMRADVLERVYEYPLVVARDPAVGAPTLVPLRRPPHVHPDLLPPPT